MKSLLQRWQQQVRHLKTMTYALYLAYRDPRVSWGARLLVAAIVAYAFSPIDLIPDFIPVLGYLDDAILLPLGIMLAIRMIPPDVLAEYRAKAETMLDSGKPVSKGVTFVIVTIWVVIAVMIVTLILPSF